jgi:hypothetical protein
MLPDTAGIKQDRIGLPDIRGDLVSPAPQAGNDHLAVQHIHLAANRLDVKMLDHEQGREKGG